MRAAGCMRLTLLSYVLLRPAQACHLPLRIFRQLAWRGGHVGRLIFIFSNRNLLQAGNMRVYLFLHFT